MRADRLLSLLMLLQSRGRVTARELAEQLEVSERTIYRDMEALGMAGIPVCAERGPGGGCFLVDGYQTRLTGLTTAEVRALFLSNMIHTMHPLADLGLSKTLDDAMLKLSAALPAGQRDDAAQVRQRIHVDTDDWQPDTSCGVLLRTLQEAIWQDRQLLIQYDEGHTPAQEQLIEPYGLVSRANAWYVVAAIADEQGEQEEQQVFNVSRINSLTLTCETFTRPDAFDLSSFWNTYRSQFTQPTQPARQQQKTASNGTTRRTFSPQKKEKMGGNALPGRRAVVAQTPQKKPILKSSRRQSQQKKAIMSSQKKEKTGLLRKKTKFPPAFAA